jgi:hypothetical protein
MAWAAGKGVSRRGAREGRMPTEGRAPVAAGPQVRRPGGASAGGASASPRSAIGEFRGNLAKFGQNPELWRFLLDTVDQVLVEASPEDRIWGIGLAQDDPRAADPTRWRGLNLLGFVLMEVRDALDQEPTARPGPAGGRHR